MSVFHILVLHFLICTGGVIRDVTVQAMQDLCGHEMDETRAATNTVGAALTSPDHVALWFSLCERLSLPTGLACIESFVNAGGLDTAARWLHALDPNMADMQRCIQACLHTVLVVCMRGVRHHRLAVARHLRLLPAVIRLMKSQAKMFVPSCLRVLVSVVDLKETQVSVCL